MPKTPHYFKGQTIVITGAASGIGRATALIFARRRQRRLRRHQRGRRRKTAEAVQALGPEALALTIDVRAAVTDMIELARPQPG